MGIVETKVKDNKKSFVQNKMLPGWDFLQTQSNRIWITWNPNVASISLLEEIE